MILDRKAIFGWAMFDFANSSFTTVMVTAYFSLYFQKYIVPIGEGGSTAEGTRLWGYANGISQAIVIMLAPFLGALADFSGAKKLFLFITYIGCSVLTMALGFVGPGHVMWGMGLFIAANFFYSSGENFAGGFLPEISPPHLMGRISGLAWGLGYIGGIGSLICATLILGLMGEPKQAADGGWTTAGGYPWVWVMIGVWFLVAGSPTFIFVKEHHRRETMPPGQNILTVGFYRVWQTLREVRRFRQLFRFLLIFTLISAGVTSVVAFASIIADETLKFSTTELGIFLMVANVAGVFGAVGWGRLQDKIGSTRAIALSLLTWLGAVMLVVVVKPDNSGAATGGARTLFWSAALLVGVGMGATNSSCRAIVGTFSPLAKSGEFFGLWGLFGKLGSIIGPVVFGVVRAETNDIRWAEIATAMFFVAGIILLRFVNEKEGRAAAEYPINPTPHGGT